MKFLLRSVLIVIILVAGFLFVDTASAAPTVDQQFGAFAGDKGANLGTAVDPRSAIANVIKTALTLMGLLMVILVIYAGVVIMTSAGNEEKVTKGKKILIGAISGLAIIIMSYSITLLVAKVLQAEKAGDGVEACIQRPSNIQKDVLGESINEGNKPSFIPYCDTF